MATLSVVGLHNKIVDDEKGIEEDAVDDNEVEEDLIPICIRCGQIMISRIANHNKSLSMVIKHQSCKRHFYETTHNCCSNTLLINSSFFFVVVYMCKCRLKSRVPFKVYALNVNEERCIHKA